MYPPVNNIINTIVHITQDISLWVIDKIMRFILFRGFTASLQIQFFSIFPFLHINMTHNFNNTTMFGECQLSGSTSINYSNLQDPAITYHFFNNGWTVLLETQGSFLAALINGSLDCRWVLFKNGCLVSRSLWCSPRCDFHCKIIKYLTWRHTQTLCTRRTSIIICTVRWEALRSYSGAQVLYFF